MPEYTTDLLDLLNVLGRLVALEPAQADLLDRIRQSELRTADELHGAGAFARPVIAPLPKKKKKSKA